jgi:nitrate/TMAO reductase-like tetraheme cytochrome c subunit
MKKSLIIIASCLFCVIVFQAFTPPQPRWHNLKILPQDISEDKLDTIMHHFTASLGVKCNYCHVRNESTTKMEFAKDDKPEKQIARKMMLMSIDINKNHFNEIEEQLNPENKTDSSKKMNDSEYMLQYVTCYTCHKGVEHPKNHPPVKED